MRAGELKKRAVIQASTVAQTGTGNPRITWSNFAVVWAGFDPQAGTEQIQGGQVNARVPVNIKTRYVAGVTPAMRLLLGARIFQIMSVVDVDERHRELDLVCTEIL